MLAINPQIYGSKFLAAFVSPADTAIKILSFETLPGGWHYGEGTSISKPIINHALAIYWRLLSLGFNKTDAFPGTFGETMVTAYQGPHYIELIAETDGSISVLYERNDETIYDQERLQFSSALDLLQKISEKIWLGEIWSTSDFYTQTTLTHTPTKTGSKAWPSGTRVVASPLCNESASIAVTAPYANTLDTFTLIASQGTPLYSGNLTSQYSLQEAS